MRDAPLPAHTVVAVTPVVPGAELSGDRVTSFAYTRVTRAGVSLGPLLGVQGGKISWSASKPIEGGGTVTVDDVGQAVNYRTERLFIEQFVNGIRIPRGVWLMTAPGESWNRSRRTRKVELLCKCAALSQAIGEPLAIPAGTAVTDVVAALIEGAGESRGAITASPKVTTSALAYQADETPLSIINKLAVAIGYASLRCDEEGQFVFEPLRRPAQRASRYDFVDSTGQAIFAPQFDRDVDYYGVPNRVIAVSAATADTDALVSVWTNTDPSSPFSYANSDNQWVTRRDTGVEVVDQASLDAYARRVGIEGSSVSSTLTLAHAPIPLNTMDVPRLVYEPAGIAAKHYIISTSVDLDPKKMATSTIRQVVDL